MLKQLYSLKRDNTATGRLFKQHGDSEFTQFNTEEISYLDIEWIENEN